VIATRDSLCGMTSPHNRHALDRVGQRAAGRRRVMGATAITAAGGAALALTFGAVFAQGSAADTTAKSSTPPATTDGWVAPAALQQAPAATHPTATPTPHPSAAPKKKVAAAAPSPPPAPPAAAPETSEPAASTGGS
jgi:hypothetical protein